MSKILIIDDEISEINKIVQCFVKHECNYTLFQTVSPKLALEIAEKMKPDVILTDWKMPEMTGIELIKMIKSNKAIKTVFPIMITGSLTSTKDMKQALDAGAVDFIRKPIDDLELLARTNATLRLADYFNTIINNKKQLNEQETIIAQQEAKLLKNELNEKNSRLLANNLKLVQLSTHFENLTKEINQITENIKPITTNKIVRTINKYRNTTLKNEWNDFIINFENQYPDFFEKLAIKYATLTTNEKRLCAFFRLNMKPKEIALITLQSEETIRKARTRLRQKMKLESNTQISDALINL